MPTSRLLTSRRTTIALALTAPVTLAACQLDPPSTSPAATPSPPPVHDGDVVASARRAILLVVASVEAVVTSHRRPGAELGLLLALHAAHLEVLDGGSEDSSVEARPPAGTAAIARKRVLAQEADLAATLADAARGAASGDLARALASMSAAIRQRVVA